MRPIPERPADAKTRKVPGHWEGDLIIGALSGSAIATLVERSSFTMLAYLGQGRSADAVRDSLIETATRMPKALRRTLTCDQGAEMAEHRALSSATNIDVFFCGKGSTCGRR